MSEAQLLHDIRLAVGQLDGVVVWRNSSGAVKTGDRWQRFGLVVGAADLVGLVAPSGRFLALEVKSERGRPTTEQVQFIRLVNRLGGVGRVVRSVEEALAAVEVARS